MTFKISGVWWNGNECECVTKQADTKKAAIGAASLLLRECNPKQIWIIDLDNKEPIPDDLGAVTCSLNKADTAQTTLEVTE
jgi:hypothetical protein